MSLVVILIIAVGLSIDALAVSGANTMYYGKGERKLWLMPIFFGFFQSFMPFLGIKLGEGLFSYIENYLEPLTCIIFILLGTKILYEAYQDSEEIEKSFSLSILLMQAILTSIDAFAVGFLFVATKTPTSEVLWIGLVTFILVAINIKAGELASNYLGKKGYFLGGLVFILLGIYHLIF